MKNNPKISFVCALSSKNRAIGYKNDLLWKIPHDLKRLRKTTINHAIIMGRKTYDSIGHPLPKRLNIILTRDKNWRAPGCKAARSVQEALKIARENEEEEVFIFGGEEIFRQTMGIADKLYLTIVEDEPKADTFFPDYREFNKVVLDEEGGEWEGLRYRFLELERK